MPANLKEVRNRIKSVISTQQITKAMKMVSAAKLRRASDGIIQMRPYANKLTDMLNNILLSTEGDVSIEYSKQREVNKVLIVLITSDRGLCGGYNANLIKLAKSTIEKNYAAQKAAGNVSVLCVGRRGYLYFRKQEYKVNSDHVNLLNELNFENASRTANIIMEGFVKGEFDKIEFIYSQFKNAATQMFTAQQFLPIAALKPKETKDNKRPDFIYEPNQVEIIRELVPKILKTQFLKALRDANASEHGARMTAMDKATENANELLRSLRLSYNRARQAAITTEISEIVGGASAMKG